MTPMEQLLDNAKSIPSIPKVLHEILATFNDPDADIDSISKPLAQDPVLSMKVLKMANSAKFGLQRQVASVNDAIQLIGLNAARNIVIASGLIGSFTAPAGVDLNRFWRLSVLSGYVAKDMAVKLRLPSESAYTAALMHGIGILSLHAVFPEQAMAIDQACEGMTACDRASFERGQLGFHHGEVGSEIANRWKLPPAISLAIRYYPEADHANARPLSATVQCAVALALDLENNKPVEVWGETISPGVSQRLGLDWDAIRYKADAFLSLRETAAQLAA